MVYVCVCTYGVRKIGSNYSHPAGCTLVKKFDHSCHVSSYDVGTIYADQSEGSAKRSDCS